MAVDGRSLRPAGDLSKLLMMMVTTVSPHVFASRGGRFAMLRCRDGLIQPYRDKALVRPSQILAMAGCSSGSTSMEPATRTRGLDMQSPMGLSKRNSSKCNYVQVGAERSALLHVSTVVPAHSHLAARFPLLSYPCRFSEPNPQLAT